MRLPGVSLHEAVKMTNSLERVLREFPEVSTVVTRIGRPEIAIDPMGVNSGDTYVLLKPQEQWTTATSREGIVEKMEDKLKELPTMNYTFSQPIEFRMMELIEGVGSRSDVVIRYLVRIWMNCASALRPWAKRFPPVEGRVRGWVLSIGVLLHLTGRAFRAPADNGCAQLFVRRILPACQTSSTCQRQAGQCGLRSSR